MTQYHTHYLQQCTTIGLKNIKLNAEYKLLNISEEEIPNVLKKVKNGEIKGINVTLPYKKS